VDRLFLDANVLFSAAYGEESPLRRLWAVKDAELLTSAYAVAEARRNLETDGQQARLDGLLGKVRVVGESEKWVLPDGVALREKDVPILCAAIDARASHLLTLDLRDFGALLGKRIKGVLLQHPRDYR
jgi:predicted nucleic acid-binding protein